MGHSTIAPKRAARSKRARQNPSLSPASTTSLAPVSKQHTSDSFCSGSMVFPRVTLAPAVRQHAQQGAQNAADNAEPSDRPEVMPEGIFKPKHRCDLPQNGAHKTDLRRLTHGVCLFSLLLLRMGIQNFMIQQAQRFRPLHQFHLQHGAVPCAIAAASFLINPCVQRSLCRYTI